MPVEIDILPEKALILVQFHGPVAVEEHIRSFEQCVENPRFNGGYHMLMDLSKGLFSETYFDDVQRLAHRMLPLYAKRSKASRTSIYAPGDVAYGMTRMYISADDGKIPYEIGLFRNLAEAFDFANIDPSDRPDIAARFAG